ncbi:hypothetical protein A2U01_0009577 [Trifolium medium]|uniref:Uncharacterized protein n=1 Tax=Trifolium medium TaxID=97028 RepID=A0A392MMF4_9FABA|nr:hypothetical protein [Trifolium medium]
MNWSNNGKDCSRRSCQTECFAIKSVSVLVKQDGEYVERLKIVRCTESMEALFVRFEFEFNGFCKRLVEERPIPFGCDWTISVGVE